METLNSFTLIIFTVLVWGFAVLCYSVCVRRFLTGFAVSKQLEAMLKLYMEVAQNEGSIPKMPDERAWVVIFDAEGGQVLHDTSSHLGERETDNHSTFRSLSKSVEQRICPFSNRLCNRYTKHAKLKYRGRDCVMVLQKSL